MCLLDKISWILEGLSEADDHEYERVIESEKERGTHTWDIWLSNCKLWYNTEKFAWLALIKCFSVLVRLSVPVSKSWIWTDGRSIDLVSSPKRNFGRVKRNCNMVTFQLVWSNHEAINFCELSVMVEVFSRCWIELWRFINSTCGAIRRHHEE